MIPQKLETAIFSLQQLKDDYQSRYEHYLALAMEAKEHRERIELLLQDLCWRETDSSRPSLAESSSIAKEQYLNEAITRGYIEQDDVDRHFHVVKPQSDIITDTSAKQKEDSSLDVVDDKQRPRNLNPNNRTRKQYKLPSSSKLKPTLVETVNGYIVKCNPKRFSIEDVVNYLYPEKQRLNWSKTTRIRVHQSIANALGRKAYLGKEWQRIEPGVYRPL